MKKHSLGRSKLSFHILIWITIFLVAPARGFQSVFAEAFIRQRLGVDKKQWEADVARLSKMVDWHRLNMADEVPVMIEALNSGESFIEHRAAALLVIFATSFPEYRDALRPAIAAMEKHLDYPDEPYGMGFWKEKTILFIASVDPNPSARAISAMIGALDDQWTPKLVAVHALTRLNPMPKQVWRTLVTKMEASPRIRGLVLESLGVNRVSTPEALEVITSAIESGEKEVQILAAVTLLELGTNAKQAIPALRRVASNPDVDSEVAEKVRLAIQSLEGKRLEE